MKPKKRRTGFTQGDVPQEGVGLESGRDARKQPIVIMGNYILDYADLIQDKAGVQ